MSLTTEITEFLQDVVAAMGVTLSPTVEETPDGTRINLEGEDGGVVPQRCVCRGIKKVQTKTKNI